jgi:hypothetical protein
MTALDQIAFSLNIRNDVPNQVLAKKLADTSDREGIQEIADHLWDKNPNIQSDCLKVLYEIGMIQPDLIGAYSIDFLKLLHSKNNRLVWGAMIALSTVGALLAEVLFPHVDEIIKATRTGSVITTDNGIKTLALVGSVKPEYRKAIFPYLLEHLQTCRPKDVPQHAEHTLAAVASENRQAFSQVLEKRIPDLSPTGLARVKKVLKLVDQMLY